MNEYENLRRIVYGEGATFVPVCVWCGRFVRADKTINYNEREGIRQENATCKKCGRTHMLFEGFI